jgi:hypothetical protein
MHHDENHKISTNVLPSEVQIDIAYLLPQVPPCSSHSSVQISTRTIHQQYHKPTYKEPILVVKGNFNK